VRPASLGGVQYDPLLVLDRGLDLNDDGAVDENDEQLIAEGIESMQVGYLFANGAIPMAGSTVGTPITFQPDVVTSTANTATSRIGTTTFPGTPSQPGESPYLASSFYRWADGTLARQSNQQANITAVRVTFLARSVASDVQSKLSGGSYLPVLNQNLQPSWVSAYASSLGGHDGYQRVVLETTVATPNLNTRAMPYF
jgi:type IV pilus assembly protein PilW